MTDAQSAPEVTQADREAAASLVPLCFGASQLWQSNVRAGYYDDGEIVQAFARHRHEAVQSQGGDLREALEAYDAVVRACPANKTFLGDRACPKCLATSNEGCRKENRAAFSFVQAVRAMLPTPPAITVDRDAGR